MTDLIERRNLFENGTLCVNLRRLREARGLTQYELATRAGISEVMVGRYERRMSRPPERTVARLLRALNGGIWKDDDQKVAVKEKPPDQVTASQTILEAKRALATTLGIDADMIEIIIRS